MPFMEKVTKKKTILAITLILLSFAHIFTFARVQAQLPSSRDLILSGNDVQEIVGCTLEVNGSIIVKDNATLKIVNSTLKFTSINYNITLKEPRNGNPRLIIINSNVSCKDPYMKKYQGFPIFCYGNGSISITNSYIERADLMAKDSSKIVIQNLKAALRVNLFNAATLNATSLNFINVKTPDFTSRLECFDNSKVFIKNSASDTSIYVRGWDSSTLKLDYCTTSWTIQLFEKSSLYIMGGRINGRLELYNASYAEMYDLSLIKNFKANGYANAKIYNTTIIFSTTEITTLSDSSAVYIEKVKIRQTLKLQNNARLNAINSQLRQVETREGAVLTAADTAIENLTAYASSTILINGKISKLNCVFYEYSQAIVTNTYCTDSTISVTDNAQVIISQSTLVGKISSNKKASLYVMGSNIQWFEVKDSAQIKMMNVTNSYLSLLDDAKLSANNAKINILTTSKNSKSSIENSKILLINIFDFSKVSITKSQIAEMAIYMDSVQGAFENLSCTTPVIVTIQRGNAPIITLSDTMVKGWNVFLKGNSMVNFTNCFLNTLEISGSTIVRFYNSTASHFTIGDSAQLYIYWYLEVAAKNGTLLRITNEEGIVFQKNITEKKVRVLLFDRVVNASTTIVKNKYTILFEQNGRQQQYNIEVNSNVVYDLITSKGIDWLTVTSITLIVIAAVILIVTILTRFHKISIKLKKESS